MMASSPGPTNDREPVPPPVMTKQSFFRLGEIRLPTDEDFEYFLSLAEMHAGWTKKYDRNGLTVWLREIPGKSVKMLKVSVLVCEGEGILRFDQCSLRACAC